MEKHPLRKLPVRIVLVTTSPSTLVAFFREQARLLRRHGFHVHTISSPRNESTDPRWRIPMHAVTMLRRISPSADLIAVVKLASLLRRIRPALIHTHTPKAGLLGMIAASFLRVRIRIYTINGSVWETQHGWRRHILRTSELVACALATDVLVVSPSLLHFVVSNGVCSPRKARVLGSGASHGVDTGRFDPGAAVVDGPGVRRRLGIPPDALVVTFVGRLVREKGIEELAAAWLEVKDRFPESYLLLCGDAEQRDPVNPATLTELRQSSRVCFSRESPDKMPDVYAASDLIVLPTWREGFPNVALETAAMRLPIVATRVTGCIDAIQDGTTGILVEPRSPGELAVAISRLLRDPSLRRRMGESARKLVSERFSEDVVGRTLIAEYRRLLENSAALV